MEVFALFLITFTFGGVIVAILPASGSGLRKVLGFAKEWLFSMMTYPWSRFSTTRGRHHHVSWNNFGIT